MSTLKPLDREAILRAAHETWGFVTAEEHSVIVGLGEAIAGVVAETVSRPVRRVGVRDVFGESGRADELLDLYRLRSANIVEEAMCLMAERR